MVKLLSFIPNDIMPRLILLVLGALVLAIIAVTVVKNRKKMPPEVWILLLVFCTLGVIGTLFVSICTAALFAIAD